MFLSGVYQPCRFELVKLIRTVQEDLPFLLIFEHGLNKSKIWGYVFSSLYYWGSDTFEFRNNKICHY